MASVPPRRGPEPPHEGMGELQGNCHEPVPTGPAERPGAERPDVDGCATGSASAAASAGRTSARAEQRPDREPVSGGPTGVDPGPGHGDGHGHGHGHGVSTDADQRWLTSALVLIVAFMVVEFAIGLVAQSLALISDSAHMLTDAASIVLALVAIRLAARPAKGRFTYGLRRAEILSAQANGISLVLLAVWFGYEGIVRLIQPPPVAGALVLITALVGIVVNVAASWCISRANRTSLNVEGAFQHIVNDLFAFIATAVAGAVVLLTGFSRADALAALVVAVLMAKAGWGLIRESGRVLIEAAPAGISPDLVGSRLVTTEDVVEVHDLHVWEITSGEPALSAHILVTRRADCHLVRVSVQRMLRAEFAITHTTLQVDHVGADGEQSQEHCVDAHGPVHRSAVSVAGGYLDQSRSAPGVTDW